ncbi:carboxypeptidase-like regulatory domain-containing protein [Tenacibaculum aiptasiae]|uniref:Carboxypeptidase-like regulatory domain-containing protein n=1 Tax=Tenacibaculum aiptasiae TaxID=426481 RepID=A0A7J5A6Q5_9FLAO|nr:carboxypeptidase-like regulatory domain-containing protein [Tenacibaculum aiptasiae]KAB1153205.1 carboxypeptidase-like regulatory domain-containing protein [Tenacibaculum aiptasiae]
MNKPLLFFLSLIIYNSNAQQKRNFLYASVKDNFNSITNAHIINLNTNQGTYTNENGEFRILAKRKDSLQISFVGYATKIFVVNSSDFGMLKTTIKLERADYELDEVVIKKHNLKGVLSIDSKQVPKDQGIVKSAKATDFSMVNFEKTIILPIDVIDRSKAPNMRKVTDPTTKIPSIGTSFNTGSLKNALRRKKLRREQKFKENFPKKLLSELSPNFFFKELKIPKDKYYHFLDYCNHLGIEKLYKNGNIFDVIKILKQESNSYLKDINLQE